MKFQKKFSESKNDTINIEDLFEIDYYGYHNISKGNAVALICIFLKNEEKLLDDNLKFSLRFLIVALRNNLEELEFLLKFGMSFASVNI